MEQLFSLGSFYHEQLTSLDRLKPIQEVVDAYIEGRSIDPSLVAQAVSLPKPSQVVSPFDLLDSWRHLLVLTLISLESECLDNVYDILVDLFHQLASESIWPECLLLSAYSSIVAQLLQKKSQPPIFYQLESGACPLMMGSHWTWGELPQANLHPELGSLWCLYAQLTGDTSYLVRAERLAKWQQNMTLDSDCTPFAGVLCREGDVSAISMALLDYIFFDLIAKATEKTGLASVSEKMLNHLSAVSSLGVTPAFSTMVVLHYWLSKRLPHYPKSTSIQLPASFSDPQLALVGCRSEKNSAVASLFGAWSGLGCYRHEDVRMISFGPQHQPLSDCRGFGIEGGTRLLGGRIKKNQVDDLRFCLSGVTRMVPQPLPSGQQSSLGGFWIDASISYENKQLSIMTTFHALANETTVAFCFFVEAVKCVVGEKHEVIKRSFNSYRGEVKNVRLIGERGEVLIESSHHQDNLSVIPLGGGEHFWGADFLVAYICSAGIDYTWRLAEVKT